MERLKAAQRRGIRASSSLLEPRAKGPVEQLKMSAAEGLVKVRPLPKSRREEESTWPVTMPQEAWVSMESCWDVNRDQTWLT